MKEIQGKTREQVMRVVNDIIFMAHRMRVPSKRVKDIFVDQILRLETLRQYCDLHEEVENKIEDEPE
jgi:hypothetical protein